MAIGPVSLTPPAASTIRRRNPLPAITLKIGAKLDPGLAGLFNPLIASANRARAQIAKAGQDGAKEYVGGYRSAPAHAKAGFDGVAKAADGANTKIVASSKRAAQEQAKDAEYVFRMKMKFFADEERAAAKSADAQAKARTSVLSKGFAGGVGMARGALGVAGQIARGAGVNMDVGSLVGKIGSQQSMAVAASNSGYVEGDKGAAGARQDPKALLSEARAAADLARISTDDAIDGLQKFVGKTTDLETGRAILERMAVQAKSTGSNMVDVMSAAAEISLKLGDIPNKGDAIARVMSVVAKQGKLGASEMSSMVTQMAKLMGHSREFGPNIEKSMSDLGAVFQITKKFGGVNGPAQAGTSVMNLVQGLKSTAGRKALHKAGIDEDSMFEGKKGDAKRELKGLDVIIPNLLKKFDGDVVKMAAAIPNTRASAVMTGFGDIYNTAEKKEKGSGFAAATAAFKEYSQNTSDADTKAALNAANDTTVSKVQLLNNQLERVTETAAERVLPAMEKLAPTIVSIADGLGQFAAYAAENPAKTMMATLSASMIKEFAAIGLKSLVEKALSGGGSTGFNVLGAATIGVAVGSIIVAKVQSDINGGASDEKTDIDAREKKVADIQDRFKKTGSLSDEDRAELVNQKKHLDDNLNDAAKPAIGNLDIYNPLSNDTARGRGEREEHFRRTGDMSGATKDIKAMLDGSAVTAMQTAFTAALAKGVKITNLPGDKPGTTTGPGSIR